MEQIETKIESTLGAVVAEMPAVDPDIVNQAAPAAVDPGRAYSRVITDRHGVAFDPVIHEINDDGTPRMSVDGYCKIKRGNGSPKQQLNIPQEEQPIPAAVIGGSATPGGDDGATAAYDTHTADLQTQAAAETTVLCFYQVGILIFGTEWQPEKDEHKNLVDVLTNYFKIKGITDLPPGVVVALAFGGYALKRFQQPITLSKLQRFTAWVKVKAINFLYWLKNKKRPAQQTQEKEIKGE